MNKMKTIILATALTILTFGAVAEELSLEDRVSKLEDKSLGLPNGFFINGEIEGYYDDKTYDSGWDSRGALQFGVETSLPNNELNIDWVGGTTTIVDVSGLNTNPAGASCSRVRLNKIWYNVSVTAPVDAVRLYWDADTDVQFLTLNYNGHMDFSSIGGIKNTEATGVTGDVKLTLPAVSNGDTASVHCEWIKVYA